MTFSTASGCFEISAGPFYRLPESRCSKSAFGSTGRLELNVARSVGADSEGIIRKRAEIEQLRKLMKAGAWSQTVAMTAIAKGEEEIQ
jgi:hypothetical protein